MPSKYYNQPLFFPKEYTDEPLRPLQVTYGRKNIYHVFYCRNGKCLRHICKTWDECHYCGQKIDWKDTDNKKKIRSRYMNETDVIGGIDCYMNGVIMDEAIIYRKGRYYFIQFVGLGKTRRISKKVYESIKETRCC